MRSRRGESSSIRQASAAGGGVPQTIEATTSPIARDGAQAGLALVRAAHAKVGATLHAGENGPAITVTWVPEEAQQGAAA